MLPEFVKDWHRRSAQQNLPVCCLGAPAFYEVHRLFVGQPVDHSLERRAIVDRSSDRDDFGQCHPTVDETLEVRPHDA